MGLGLGWGLERGGVRAGSLALFALFFLWQAATSWHLAVFAAFTVALYVLGNWLTRRAAFSWPVLAGLGATALEHHKRSVRRGREDSS